MEGDVEFTFTWILENLTKTCREESMKSPEFYAVNTRSKWFLEIPQIGDYVCVNLCRKGKCRLLKKQQIRVSFTLIAENANENLTEETLINWNDSETFIVFRSVCHVLLNQMYLPDGVVTFQCRLALEQTVSRDDVPPKDIVNSPLCSKLILCEEVFVSSPTAPSEIAVCYPVKSCVYTYLESVDRSVTWKIEGFCLRYPDEKMSLLLPISDNSSLLLILYFAAKCEPMISLFMDIRRKVPDYDIEMMVLGHVRLIGIRDIFESAIENHVFNRENEVWQFPSLVRFEDLMMKRLFYLKDNTLTIKCTFTIIHQKAEYHLTKTSLLKRDLGEVCSVFKKDMLNMYFNHKDCDTNLCTEDQIFTAHRNIICARSPVFRAMFERDMKEKETNTVNIPDVDSKTLKRLLIFIYSSRVDRMEYEDAAKLYRAADKYDIPTLKNRCSIILQASVSLSNFCEMLAIADLFHDGSLLKKVKNFMAFQAENAFTSPQWKDFLKSNRSRALEFAYEIFLRKLQSSW